MGATALLSSCNTLMKTSRTADTSNNLRSATVVDIVPATEHRITHTVRPGEALLRGGENNVRQAVEHEALVKYGNADILLEPQYIIEKERRLFRSKITSITVSGRPAYYTNYRTLHDSVWSNPVFRGMRVPQAKVAPVMGSPLGQIKKPAASQAPAFREKGFAMYLTPFVGDTGDQYCEHNDYSSSTFAATLTLGYQLNPYFYVGVGAGINHLFESYYGSDSYHPNFRGSYIPLYVNARLNLSRNKNTLFLDGKFGCGVGGNDVLGGGDEFYGAAVGYSFGNIDVAFQYLYTYSHFEYERWRYSSYGGYWSTEYDSMDFPQMGVAIGFRF